MSCEWMIAAASSIELRFSEFALEANYDWLKVYEDTTNDLPVLALTGSQIPAPVTLPQVLARTHARTHAYTHTYTHACMHARMHHAYTHARRVGRGLC